MRTYWRNLRLFMFAFFVLSFGYGHVDAAARQSKSFVYDRIDVNLRLQPDGTLDVTERMTLRYSGGPFTSASREIPFQRLDAIEAIDVSKGATSYSEVANDDRTPGTFHTSRDQQKVVITWFYPPTSDNDQTFVLSYRVRGAVRVGREEDELWWVAIFPDRSVPVEHSRVTLTLPSSARPRTADVSLPTGSGKLVIEQNTITITRDEPLPPNTGLDIQVRVPGDLITSAAPQWQGATNPVDSIAPTPITIEPQINPNAPVSLPGGMIVVGLAALAGGSLIFLRSRQQRRDRQAQQRRIMEYNAKHEKRNSAQTTKQNRQRRAESSGYASSQADSGSSWSSSSSDSGSSWSSSSDSSWSSSSSDSGSSSSSSDSSSSSSSDSGGSGGGGGNAD